MNVPSKPDADLEQRLSDRLMDVFIRAALILVMAILCYQIFSPFLSLMVWALILAITMYPAHQKLANPALQEFSVYGTRPALYRLRALDELKAL